MKLKSLILVLLFAFSGIASAATSYNYQHPDTKQLYAQLDTIHLDSAGNASGTITFVPEPGATTHTDSAVVEVAHELGVEIDPQASESDIVQKVVKAYQFIPNKDTGAGGWVKFILMIAGTIGTVVYYILHKIQKKKHDALLAKQS